ncbi:MAG: XdhC family protein [Novosphingobium sp.]
MRNPGTHMAVCADGGFVGSLSGGCIENAVVAEACDALKAGAAPRSPPGRPWAGQHRPVVGSGYLARRHRAGECRDRVSPPRTARSARHPP